MEKNENRWPCWRIFLPTNIIELVKFPPLFFDIWTGHLREEQRVVEAVERYGDCFVDRCLLTCSLCKDRKSKGAIHSFILLADLWDLHSGNKFWIMIMESVFGGTFLAGIVEFPPLYPMCPHIPVWWPCPISTFSTGWRQLASTFLLDACHGQSAHQFYIFSLTHPFL